MAPAQALAQDSDSVKVTVLSKVKAMDSDKDSAKVKAKEMGKVQEKVKD